MIGGSWSFIIERSTKRKGHRVETPEETRYAEEPEPSTVRVRGIDVPVRPQPPGPEDCCMSGTLLLTGCVNCVYVQYTDELKEYKEEMEKVKPKLAALDPPLHPEEWDERLGPMPGSGDKDTPVDDGLDASTRAFLELERKLNAK